MRSEPVLPVPDRPPAPTHVVGVVGIIIHNGAVLLLSRSRQPKVWAPPGGRLLPDEDPLVGLRREVSEECALSIEPVAPISTWFGVHEGTPTLGIVFVCKYVSGDVSLSDEHSSARWFSPDRLFEEMRPSPDSFWGDHSLYRLAFALSTVLPIDAAEST